MAKHTPGPWKWWTSNSVRRLTGHGLPGGQFKQDGDVLHAFRSRSDGVADLSVSGEDAGLIAAAPEMYAALEQIVQILNERKMHTDQLHRIATIALAHADTNPFR